MMWLLSLDWAWMKCEKGSGNLGEVMQEQQGWPKIERLGEKEDEEWAIVNVT